MKQIVVTLDIFDSIEDKSYKGEIYKGEEKDYHGPIGVFDEGQVYLNYIVDYVVDHNVRDN